MPEVIEHGIPVCVTANRLRRLLYFATDLIWIARWKQALQKHMAVCKTCAARGRALNELARSARMPDLSIVEMENI